MITSTPELVYIESARKKEASHHSLVAMKATWIITRQKYNLMLRLLNSNGLQLACILIHRPYLQLYILHHWFLSEYPIYANEINFY